MITWAPIIPLIGGFPLGAEKAFNRPPMEIFSYNGFWDNDSHYVNYMRKKYGEEQFDYMMLDEKPVHMELDVIVGTPPCSGLSTMNSGTSPDSKGAGCHKNEWMYRIFEDGMKIFNAKVIAIENAPALYTKAGVPVAEKIYNICKENGYSLTLYKTSTHYHGVPQVRDRTFAIAWKSEFAPIMNWYNRDKDNWVDYLNKISTDSVQYNEVIDTKLLDDPFWNYIIHSSNRNPRELVIEAEVKTAFNYIYKTGQLEKAKEWFEETNNVIGLKLTNHAIKKFSINKGIWDSSVRVFDDCMNAVIGKNIVSTIHPLEDRSLTIRECLHMMGFPDDFELLNPSRNVNHIAQNVPVCTAADICNEIKLFLEDKLEFSSTDFLKQNNHKKEIEYVNSEKRNLFTV